MFQAGLECKRQIWHTDESVIDQSIEARLKLATQIERVIEHILHLGF